MNLCPACYLAEIPNCANTINVSAGLANGIYTVAFVDKFSNKHLVTAEAIDGVLSIDVADLPPYLLNPYAGVFDIQVFEVGGCEALELTIDEVAYTCIQIQVIQTTGGDNDVATIPCE